MIVTFLYRIKNEDNSRQYGKYIGKCPILYEEGLDRGLAELLFPLFSQLLPHSITDPSDIAIGVLSVDRESTHYYSEHEKNVFDLLYCNWSNLPSEIYFKGKQIDPKRI